MAKLPEITQFGTPKFASGFKPLSAGQLDLSAPAKAMTKVAEGLDDVSSLLAKKGKEDEDRKDALNKLETDAGFKDELRAFNNSFDNSTDYDNMEGNHAKGSEAIVNKYASMIRDPDARERWKASALDTVRSDNQRFHTIAKQGKEDKFIAGVNTTIEQRDGPLGNVGTKPSQIADASQKTMSDIDYLVEKGMISFQKGQELKSTRKKGYKDLYIKSGILNDPHKTYEDVSWYGKQRGTRRMSTTGNVVLERTGQIKDSKAKSAVAEKAYAFFLSKGLKPYQAAALAGNMAWESGGNPFEVYSGKDGKGDNWKNSPNSPHSAGIIQWNDRLPAAVAFWRKNGIDIPANIDLRNRNDVKAMIKMVPIEQQLAFAWHELETTEKRALDGVKNARNLDEATAGAIGLHRPKGWTRSNPRGGMHYGERIRLSGRILDGYAVRGGDTAASKADVESGNLPPAMSEEDAARFAEMDSLFGDASDAEINGYLEKFRRVMAGNDANAVNGIAQRVFDTGKLTAEDEAVRERLKKTNKNLSAKLETAIKGAAFAASARFGTNTINQDIPIEEMSTDQLTDHVNALKRQVRTMTKDSEDYQARTVAIKKLDAQISKMKSLRHSDPGASVDNIKEVIAAKDMKEFIGSVYGVGQEDKQPVAGEIPQMPEGMAIPSGMGADLQGQFTGTPAGAPGMPLGTQGAYAGVDKKAKEQEAELGIIQARLAAQEKIGIPKADRRSITVEQARDLLNYTARAGQEREGVKELEKALDDAYKRALAQVGDEEMAGRMVYDAYYLTAKRQETAKKKRMVNAYHPDNRNLSRGDQARMIQADIDQDNLDWSGPEQSPAITYETPSMRSSPGLALPSSRIIDHLRNNLNDPNVVAEFARRYGDWALRQALTEPNKTEGPPTAPAQQGVDRYGRPETGGSLLNIFK